MAQHAYDEALAAYTDAQESVEALEEQAMLALKGKGKLNLDMISSMQTKYQNRLAQTKDALDEAKTRLDDERMREQAEKAKLRKILSWSECFDRANLETQHMILAALIEKIEVGRGYKLTIHYRLAAEQFFNVEDGDTSHISA